VEVQTRPDSIPFICWTGTPKFGLKLQSNVKYVLMQKTRLALGKEPIIPHNYSTLI